MSDSDGKLRPRCEIGVEKMALSVTDDRSENMMEFG